MRQQLVAMALLGALTLTRPAAAQPLDLSKIFHAYDIRGKYPGEIDEETVRRIGYEMGRRLGGKGTYAIGRDMRIGSPPLMAAYADGLRRAGLDVVDLGLVTTPSVYFAVVKNGYVGGAMITASHNPGIYDGIKPVLANAVPVDQRGLEELRKAVEDHAHEPLPPVVPGTTLTTTDVKDAYVQHLLDETHGAIGKLRVAIDAGNGATGFLLPKLLDRLPQLRAKRMYFEPDGNFPNHEANPLVESNLADLKKVMKTGRYDLGIAYDGDGDRVFFVDEKGNVVPADVMTALLATRVLAEDKGGAVVYDLRSSRVVAEEILKAGGTPVEERVGHSFFKKTMRERDARFAGELSGHFYWKQAGAFFDSGLLTTLKVLSMISTEGKKLSELVAPLLRTARSGEINFEVADKDAALRALETLFPGGEVSHLDGVTVKLPDFWFNARKSNTEPLLRLNVEANDRTVLDAALSKIEATIRPPARSPGLTGLLQDRIAAERDAASADER